MPKGFDACRKKGGKIRTKKLSGGGYVPICYLGGKAYRGYEKKGGGNFSQGYSEGLPYKLTPEGKANKNKKDGGR